MPDYANWLLKVDDHIATLTLNRTHAMNSLTPDTLHELRAIAHSLRDNDAVWAVILEGAGPHFSVGVDVGAIGQMMGQDPDAYQANLLDLQDCLDQFEALPMPTIAKIRGHCIGGGMLLTLCCDFRLADTTVRFYVPEVRLGIAVVMGTQRITRIAGIGATKAMVLLAEPFGAATADNYGLLHGIAEPADLDSTVNEFAGKFRNLPPRTIRIAKRIIDEGATMTLRDSQNFEAELQSTLLNDADFAEGVAAFFEKRPPQFTGK